MKGGSLIRRARRRVGLTQEALADRLGTTQSAIARWENGATEPAFATVVRAIRACGIDLELSLVPKDDHDETLILQLLQLTPAERVERHQSLHDIERRLTSAVPVR